MKTAFNQFLRKGGCGEFVVSHKSGPQFGYQTALAMKAEFPNYSTLRKNFADKLDEVIRPLRMVDSFSGRKPSVPD